MNAKGNVKVTKLNAQWTSALCLALWDEPTVKEYVGSEDAPILRLAVAEIEPKATAKLVVPVKSWGWAVILRATKKTGAVLFVPRSKQARKWVRLLHVSNRHEVSLTQRKRWVTYARS